MTIYTKKVSGVCPNCGDVVPSQWSAEGYVICNNCGCYFNVDHSGGLV